ncbi:MAG: hypothetical protein Q9165_004886, partial [Trypethelium subeluteriae]
LSSFVLRFFSAPATLSRDNLSNGRTSTNSSRFADTTALNSTPSSIHVPRVRPLLSPTSSMCADTTANDSTPSSIFVPKVRAVANLYRDAPEGELSAMARLLGIESSSMSPPPPSSPSSSRHPAPSRLSPSSSSFGWSTSISTSARLQLLDRHRASCTARIASRPASLTSSSGTSLSISTSARLQLLDTDRAGCTARSFDHTASASSTFLSRPSLFQGSTNRGNPQPTSVVAPSPSSSSSLGSPSLLDSLHASDFDQLGTQLGTPQPTLGESDGLEHGKADFSLPPRPSAPAPPSSSSSSADSLLTSDWSELSDHRQSTPQPIFRESDELRELRTSMAKLSIPQSPQSPTDSFLASRWSQLSGIRQGTPEAWLRQSDELRVVEDGMAELEAENEGLKMENTGLKKENEELGYLIRVLTAEVKKLLPLRESTPSTTDRSTDRRPAPSTLPRPVPPPAAPRPTPTALPRPAPSAVARPSALPRPTPSARPRPSPSTAAKPDSSAARRSALSFIPRPAPARTIAARRHTPAAVLSASTEVEVLREEMKVLRQEVATLKNDKKTFGARERLYKDAVKVQREKEKGFAEREKRVQEKERLVLERERKSRDALMAARGREECLKLREKNCHAGIQGLMVAKKNLEREVSELTTQISRGGGQVKSGKRGLAGDKRIAANVLRRLLLLLTSAAAAEHLLEELELRGGREDEGKESVEDGKTEPHGAGAEDVNGRRPRLRRQDLCLEKRRRAPATYDYLHLPLPTIIYSFLQLLQLSRMHLMYYLNDNGERVYTIAKSDPFGRPTKSAHPARFSPDEKEDLVGCRVALKDRYRLLPQQVQQDEEDAASRKEQESIARLQTALLNRQIQDMLESQRSILGPAAFEDTGDGPAIAGAVREELGIGPGINDSTTNDQVTTSKRKLTETPAEDKPEKHKSKHKRVKTVRPSQTV